MTLLDLYRHELNDALDSISDADHKARIEHLTRAAYTTTPVYVFGNGGSASTADHFACEGIVSQSGWNRYMVTCRRELFPPLTYAPH